MLLTFAVPPVKPRGAPSLGIIFSFLAAMGVSKPGLADGESAPNQVSDGEPNRPVTSTSRSDIVPPRLLHFEQAQ